MHGIVSYFRTDGISIHRVNRKFFFKSKMLALHNYDSLEEWYGNISWNIREAKRTFEELYQISTVVDPNGESFQIPYRNTFQKRNELNAFRHHLSEMVNLVGSFNPDIIKRKLDFEHEKVKRLTTEKVSMQKNLFVQGRRLSSLYCQISQSLTNTINLESTIEDIRGKLKETRNENKQLRKRIENGDQLVKEKKQKKTFANDSATSNVFDPSSNNGAVGSSSAAAVAATSSTNGQPSLHAKKNSIPASKKGAQSTVDGDPLVATPSPDTDEPATQKRRRELLLSDNDLLSVESNASSHRLGSKSSSTGPSDGYMYHTVRKDFDPHGVFVGMVVDYVQPYFRVVYEDGDSEELNRTEVKMLLTTLTPKEIEKLRKGVVETDFAETVNSHLNALSGSIV